MTLPEPCVVGVIGGSGVYSMDIMQNPERVTLSTPFGAPSDVITIATIHGIRCAFIPRHGRGHVLTPSEVPYRANIYALKMLGVKYLVSVSAVGSLREDRAPGDLVLVDQLIDQTKLRVSTFFGNGVVGHVPFGHPICPQFRELALPAIEAALPGVKVWPSGTLVTMEGPVFSSKAESLFHRQIGGDLIGMTTATESKLAKEAEMAHLTVAMVTDYDAWNDDPNAHVDVAKVMETLHKNSGNAQKFLGAIIEVVAKTKFTSEAHTALQYAIMTSPDMIPEERKRNLQHLIGRLVPHKQ
jgi:5'-methylthioadenosine phosphorylase